MAEAVRGKVTSLLVAMDDGDESARTRLFDLVYEELHRVADGLMRRERPGHTLQPTALVNEAFLKLFVGREFRASNRAHFFAAAANAMRQILVDHARRRNANVRGGGAVRVPLDDVLNWFEDTHQVRMLEVDDALSKLTSHSPRQHEVVMLRIFGGLTNEEIAARQNVSLSTVEKDWRFARVWLYSELRESEK